MKESVSYVWRILLYITDQTQESFLVYPCLNPVTTQREKWCLPTIQVEGDPAHVLRQAEKLAFNYYSIDVNQDDLINHFIEFPSRACIIMNQSTNTGIEKVFREIRSGYKKHYFCLDRKQAVLPESGLDRDQKELLIESGLLNKPDVSVLKDKERNIDRSRVVSFSSRRKSRFGFHPKPL